MEVEHPIEVAAVELTRELIPPYIVREEAIESIPTTSAERPKDHATVVMFVLVCRRP
jgi:hypothetical protein